MMLIKVYDIKSTWFSGLSRVSSLCATVTQPYICYSFQAGKQSYNFLKKNTF